MKFILQLCLCLSISLSINAQAILEKAYPTTDLHRVNWTFGGEKYWYSDDSLKEIKVFSDRHQLLKTIKYPSVLNNQVRLLQSEQAVTQTTVNSDDLLEMVWFFKDTLTKQEKFKIINDKDSVLFTLNAATEIVSFSEIEGLATKMFVTTYETNLSEYTTKVYALPSFSIENIYFRAYRLHRKKFGYAGEKYFYKDAAGKKMQIYNPNHSIWKSFGLELFAGITIDNNDGFTDADDNVFDKDSLVEIVFSYGSGSNLRHTVINENYRTLYVSSYNFGIDRQNGLADRFLGIQVRNNGDVYHGLYSLPDLRLDLESSYRIGRALLKKHGETVFRYNPPNQLLLSYNNFMSNKTLNIPASASTNIDYPTSLFASTNVPFVNDTIINKDSLIEVIYTEYNYQSKQYTVKIINDTGKIYNRMDDTRYFSVNSTKGLTDKLMTKTGNDKPFETKVWRLSNTTATKETPSVIDVNIYPNPFLQNITIETKGHSVFPLTIRLINALGEVVLATNMNERRTDLTLPNLSKGVYILEISNEQQRSLRKIIKM
jgi:hypothetical protein